MLIRLKLDIILLAIRSLIENTNTPINVRVSPGSTLYIAEPGDVQVRVAEGEAVIYEGWSAAIGVDSSFLPGRETIGTLLISGFPAEFVVTTRQLTDDEEVDFENLNGVSPGEIIYTNGVIVGGVDDVGEISWVEKLNDVNVSVESAQLIS